MNLYIISEAGQVNILITFMPGEKVLSDFEIYMFLIKIISRTFRNKNHIEGVT